MQKRNNYLTNFRCSCIIIRTKYTQQKIEKDTRIDLMSDDEWEDYVNRILPEDGYTVLKNTGFEVTFITTPTFTNLYKGNCINTIANCIVGVNVPSVK